jgi:uncharacterized protein
MTMRGYHPDSTVRKDANQRPAAEASAVAPPSLDAGKHCAYNQTRERFLSAEIEAADFSSSSLIDNRLPALAPGAGLWLVPFMGISATSVRIPVDLIYLDRECTVVDTVESFPLARGSALSLPSVSVLVLPAETIRATETQLGDQLMVCAPEEMKRRLQKLATPGTDAKADANAARNGTGRVLEWDARMRARTTAEKISMGETAAAEIAAQPENAAPQRPETRAAAPVQEQSVALVETRVAPEIAQPAVDNAAPETGKTGKAKPQRSWLQKLLKPEPADNRRTAREALPGLAAYFFTGGAPVAHGVRDISLTGMYVFTNERWYPGTMVRMTISDSSDRVVERSITLNTTVVRAGDDGVGLRFVLETGKGRQPMDGMSYGANIQHIQEFLLRVKNAQQNTQQ